MLPLLATILLMCSCSKGTTGTANAATEGRQAKRTDMDKKPRTMMLAVGETAFTVSLAENETARELAARLPLRLEMTELNGNEKYASLDSPLPSSPAKVHRIEAGDVMLWGDDCLVVFYKSFDTPYSYTRIGHLDDASALADTVGTGNVVMNLAPIP